MHIFLLSLFHWLWQKKEFLAEALLKVRKRAFLFSSLYCPNVGGVENSLKEFSSVLKMKEYDVTIITSNRDNVNNSILKEYDCIDGVAVVRCDYPYGKLGFITFLRELKKKIKGLNISSDDFIISRSHWPVLGLKACGFKKINYLAPSVYCFQEKISLRYFFSKKIIGYLINTFSQFLAFSSSEVYVFSKDMSIQSKRASLGLCDPVILNPGVSSERFFQVDLKNRYNIRKNLDLQEDKKYLLCVGRLSEIKQFDIAIDSLKYLSDEYHVLIVGAGPELERLKNQIQSADLVNRVTLRPFTNEVDLYYKAADIYLMTSRYEAFGQVLLEATACGLPVIAFSSMSGVRTSVSYIYGGFSSLLSECHEQSPKALAKTITDFKVNTIKFEQEVSAFRGQYSWQSTVEKMM